LQANSGVVGGYEGWKSIAEHKPESIELAKHATSLESNCPTKLKRSVNQPGSHQKALHGRTHENEATLI
jgi:hypothetical protein